MGRFLWQYIHVMHNVLEAAVQDPTIELTDAEKGYDLKIKETEKKCLDKLQEEVSLINFFLIQTLSSINLIFV